MEYRRLGHTDLNVSSLCLGTMTWGNQNTTEEGHAQMDMALDYGVNFFDTAEMYAVPASTETSFLTETIIGEWFARTGNRDKVILATKAAGPGDYVKHIRGGPRFSADSLVSAVEGSLKRLQTGVIDLYQLHWPERTTNYFGRLGYKHRDGEDGIAISETVAGLKKLMDAGKIRHWGLSNETPWGVMSFIHEAEKIGLPRPVSIQNPYSLLNRSYEVGLAEVSHRENVGLLAYSPMAFGLLSGKYADGARPPKGRLSLYSRFTRYFNPQSEAACARYVALAREHGLDPAQMALAFVTGRSFVTSNIIGATTLEQLESNLASAELVLSEEVLAGIEAIHKDQPNPAP